MRAIKYDKRLLALAAFFLASIGLLANEHWYFNADANGVAVDGYDVVAMVAEGKALKGKPSIQASEQGLIYQFSTEDHRKAFQKEPQKYLPQYGGWCAFSCGVDSGKFGFGPARFKPDPESFLVSGGRLYLFARLPNYQAKTLWEGGDAEALIGRANAYWAGRVAMGKAIGDLPEGMAPSAPMETAQFNPLIGKWTNTVRWMQNLKEKTYGPGIKGTWEFRYGWDGFGIDDNWKQVGIPGSGGPAHRFYDPTTKKWVMVYMPANQPRARIWSIEGEFDEKGELTGQFEGKDPGGREFLGRIRFYDIKKDRFLWQHDRSYDGGKTWIEKVAVSESVRLG